MCVFFVACSSENEHFCVRYEYVYTQLDDPSLPSYSELKQQLQMDILEKSKDNDHEKFMLFVLEDYRAEAKPHNISPKDYCLQAKRWTSYH